MAGFAGAGELYLSQRLIMGENLEQAEGAYSVIDQRSVGRAVWQAVSRGVLLTIVLLPTLLIGIGIILIPLAWIVPWFLRDNVYGGHWYYSVENGWYLNESAFALIAQRLKEKNIPATVKPRIMASRFSQSPRYYLSVRQGRHVGYISVFAYGADLFVSWTLWREERPLSVLWNWAKESFLRAVGKGTAFHEIVRYDPARAMRESIHNATRAGVDAALSGQTATVAGTFGEELPVESDGAQAPAPTQPAAVPPPPVAAGNGAPSEVPPPPVEVVVLPESESGSDPT